MRRSVIANESIRAPGLPYPPRQFPKASEMKIIKFVSINYDYLPMNLESPKMLWLDLASPAPRDLIVGTPIRLNLAPGVIIQTKFGRLSGGNSFFEVDDVVGSRIILSPYRGSTWLPTVHEACDNPFGWGYDMKTVNVRTAAHATKYGYGDSESYIEYFPAQYNTRATRLEAVMIEEDFYRGTRTVPGW